MLVINKWPIHVSQYLDLVKEEEVVVNPEEFLKENQEDPEDPEDPENFQNSMHSRNICIME